MLNDLLRSLSSANWLALGTGLALGIGVLFLIRARQAWRYRQAYGYNVYTANARRRRLYGWAGLALLGVIIVAGIYVWRIIQPSDSTNASPASLSQANDPLAGMLLVIPSIGIETNMIEAPIVAQQWDVSRLTTEVAHLAGTAYPGQPGNAALAGHITIPGAGWGPFKDLGMLEVGERVFIEIGEKTLVYEVSEIKTVDVNAVEVVYPTDDTRLTLLTCTGWDGVLEHYTQRIVVVAQLTP
jgi:LPXTG-site transpeptidase (sortase) family protein